VETDWWLAFYGDLRRRYFKFEIKRRIGPSLLAQAAVPSSRCIPGRLIRATFS
jgi:hypothetical protein